MPQDLLALVRRLGSPEPDEREEAILEAYTSICHQAQTVYAESVATIDPLVALAVDPTCPGRADALQLLADIAGSTNSAPADYEAARAAVRRRLPDLMASVATDPTPATVVVLAQLAWSYPHDAAIETTVLTALLPRFDEASVILALALALQAHGVSDASPLAFHTAFAETQAPGTQGPGRLGTALRALGLRSQRSSGRRC
jgi:hypothetical protein